MLGVGFSVRWGNVGPRPNNRVPHQSRPKAVGISVRQCLLFVGDAVDSAGQIVGYQQRAVVEHGHIHGAAFYISGPQYEAWKHTDLTIDVVPGRGGMFSLDNGRERRFLTRPTLCAVRP